MSFCFIFFLSVFPYFVYPLSNFLHFLFFETFNFLQFYPPFFSANLKHFLGPVVPRSAILCSPGDSERRIVIVDGGRVIVDGGIVKVDGGIVIVDGGIVTVVSDRGQA